jgi:hypothetical protein
MFKYSKSEKNYIYNTSDPNILDKGYLSSTISIII